MFPKKLKYIVILFAIIITSCAKRGTITGGDKDTIAPVLTGSFPKNFSTNFNSKEIKLVFDEYVKLKNVNKQLIVSPPFKNQPEILPTNASKTITIKIKDTLQPNTTYNLNFGQSIEDNNEGNPYQQFKYVFSTGTYIDSLKLNVKVKDALEKKTDNFVSVMLYEINEKFNDSTIYKETPRYITNTLDSLKIVTLDNLKDGKYLLIALKDNGNNKFNPKTDKIGFQKQYVTVPSDTIYEVELFMEVLPFKSFKPSQISGNKIAVGYEGNPKNTKITLKKGNDIIPSMVTKFPKKDSLQVWHREYKADSLSVEVENGSYHQNYMVKLKNQKRDSLSITAEISGILPFRERFQLNSSTPLVKFDESKINVFRKDSTKVNFKTQYDEFNREFFIDFDKEPSEKYTIQAFPGAFLDFFDSVNDTLKYTVTTKNMTEYGNLKVVLEGAKKFPIIVQLTDKDGKIKASMITEKNPTVEFLALEPLLYTLRIIYDENGNGVWDTGSYLKKRQPEEVIYFPKEIDVRANWDVEQPFNLVITN